MKMFNFFLIISTFVFVFSGCAIKQSESKKIPVFDAYEQAEDAVMKNNEHNSQKEKAMME
jgi:hypothetical protein